MLFLCTLVGKKLGDMGAVKKIHVSHVAGPGSETVFGQFSVQKRYFRMSTMDFCVYAAYGEQKHAIHHGCTHVYSRFPHIFSYIVTACAHISEKPAAKHTRVPWHVLGILTSGKPAVTVCGTNDGICH